MYIDIENVVLQGWNNGRESSASRYRSRYFWPRLFVPTKSIDSAHGDAVLPWFIVAGIVSSVNDIRLRFGRTTLMQMQKRRVKSFVARGPVFKTGRPRDDYQRVWPGSRRPPPLCHPARIPCKLFSFK